MDTLQFAMSPQDWITYSERTKSRGELSAMQWLMDKYDPAPLRSFWDGEQLVPISLVSRPVSAWLAANQGEMPTEPAQVLPFAKTADERTALERLSQNIPGMSEEERNALRRAHLGTTTKPPEFANPKSEFQNPKQIQNSNRESLETPRSGSRCSQARVRGRRCR